MVNDNYKLILNDISNGESLGAPKDWEHYRKFVQLFLSHKGKYFFADEILNRYHEHVTLEQVFEQEKDKFIPAGSRKRDGVLEPTWFDALGMEEIVSTDEFFDFFFACKLRQLNLPEISDFLSFHLEYSFHNNRQAFFKFLNLPLSQHQNQVTPIIRESVNDWVKTNEAKNLDEPSDTDKEEKVKGRITREPGDHLTALNLNQIALLIQLMQQTGVILKGDYLTYTQAGKAFNLLTGYSAHTIRQQLGTKGEIEGVKFEDYKELHEIIMRMASLIEAKIPKK